MTAHGWLILAFIAFIVAAAFAARDKAWPVCLVAAGLALWLVPPVFQITN